jgi:hypothetical protein
MKLRLIKNNRKKKERKKKIKIVTLTCPMGKEEKNQQMFSVFI